MRIALEHFYYRNTESDGILKDLWQEDVGSIGQAFLIGKNSLLVISPRMYQSDVFLFYCKI